MWAHKTAKKMQRRFNRYIQTGDQQRSNAILKKFNPSTLTWKLRKQSTENSKTLLKTQKTQLIWFGTKLSHLSFSKHLLHLTCSCYYTNLRRMTAICRHVHSSVFFTIAHAFICSCLENCNSLHAGLPKTCLSSLQSVINSAVRLTAHLSLTALVSSPSWLMFCTGFQLLLAFSIKSSSRLLMLNKVNHQNISVI